MKKGISPLIATVLLIGFTVALTSIVMMWGKGFVTEKTTKEGALAEARMDCLEVEFTVDKSCRPQAAQNDISLTLRNLKNTKVDAFVFTSAQLEDVIEKNEELAGLGMKEFTITAPNLQTIDIVPQKRVGGNYIPCSGSTKSVRITNPCP